MFRRLIIGSFLVLGIGALALSGAAATGPTLSFADAKHYPIGTGPCSMAIGELNGDAKLDVVTGTCDSAGVSVLLNRGNGSFEARRDYADGHKPGPVHLADLNGDGRSDLVTANLDRTISVLSNQGAGTFGSPVTYALRLARPRDALREVMIADLNGDDRPDLVTETGIGDPDTVSVMLNRGDGTFDPRRAYLTQGQGIFDVALGDLNGDAKPELVIANPGAGSDGGLSVLVNAGDGSFETRRDYEMSVERVAIGDLNGDGKADVATADASSVSVLFNRGDGSLGLGHTYCRTCPISEEANAIAIADVSGDAKADLVAYWDEGGSQTVSVLLNKGLGIFSRRRSYQLSYLESPSLEIVDLNGDGKPDIAAPNYGERGLSVLSVLLNNGSGWFGPGLDYRFGGDASAVASADLNGDGRQDLASALYGRHTIAVKLNAPDLCNVQRVGGMTVAAARQKLGRANCRVGKVTRAFERHVAKGQVIAQRPRFGAVLPDGTRVSLVVSRGKKRR